MSDQGFVWNGRTITKLGDVIDAMSSCQAEEEAQSFLAAYREYCEAQGSPRDVADKNLGYSLGYLDREEWARLQPLFHVTHPIFGDVPPVSPREAFDAGVKMGEGSRP